MFIGIFMLPFYLKYLGAEEYGLVGFFTMLTSWMMLLDMGLSSTLSREAARLKNKINGIIKLKNTLRSVEIIIFALVLIVFVFIFVNSEWIATHWLKVNNLDHQVVEKCIKLMGFMLSIRWFVSLHQGIVSGFEQQVWLNIYKMSINTIKFVGGLILIIFISNNIFHFFIFQTIIAIIELLVLGNKTYSNLRVSERINPSVDDIKRIAPFALSVAYTSFIWAISSQFDKLLLSHYIQLKEYGYFALVVAIQGAIMQFSGPISRAILPRMISLLSQDKEEEMLVLYRKSTQLISIITISVIGIVAFFSYELLFSWTGNNEASHWASPILFWYALGNGVLALKAFQYNLQYMHGDMKYQNISNTIYPLISLPIIYYAVMNYGAIGSGIAWFVLNSFSFFILSYLVHKKLAPGIHSSWLTTDILPAIIMTTIYIFIIKTIDINFDTYNRVEVFMILLCLGIALLLCNILIYKNTRKIFLNKLIKIRYLGE